MTPEIVPVPGLSQILSRGPSIAHLTDGHIVLTHGTRLTISVERAGAGIEILCRQCPTSERAMKSVMRAGVVERARRLEAEMLADGVARRVLRSLRGPRRRTESAPLAGRPQETQREKRDREMLALLS